MSEHSNTEAAILARIMNSQELLSPAAANYLLSLRFREDDVARMNELSDLAEQGKLTVEEQTELDSYIHISNFLALMQSKGRQALQSFHQ